MVKGTWIDLESGNTLLVKGPLRSGERVEFDGNIVVEGDVNPGAEIIAGGNILIFGILRGVARCGCYGDEDTKVSAFSLFPTQLRIGSHISCPPQGYRGLSGSGPETAMVKDGKVIIESL